MDDTVTFEDFKTRNYKYYIGLISITILYYDYYLTFAMEIDRMWSRGGFSLAMTLFYVNRYVNIFGHIPVMVEYFWVSSSSHKIQICHSLQSYHQYFSIVVQLVIATLLSIRVYALYGRRRRVLFLLFAVILAAFAAGCWSFISKKKEEKPSIYLPTGCAATHPRDEAIHLTIAWGGMLVFDMIIFLMTLYKALVVPRLGETSLLTILLRDGTLYFACIAASNLANMLTLVYGGLFTRGVATTFTNVISSTMTSRLMLNLRHPALWSNTEQSAQFQGDTDLRFRVASSQTFQESRPKFEEQRSNTGVLNERVFFSLEENTNSVEERSRPVLP
ncbi:hypothetical protein CPB83DRAFT_859539 [Crepidotus variabilis]|uniref:DUF6533 domain-containing protein n=1 Tax=Crepidotus variabilis TaxID=179855 RepID=A0A9P6EA93_9AGAR|nr:hypothetical protein CPB83DRAFT_859539 [Crepidotus variabilis]